MIKSLFQIRAVVIMLLFAACNSEDLVAPEESLLEQNIISKDEAVIIARNFVQNNSSSSRLNLNQKFTVAEVKGSNGKPAIYILNNEQGGWEIIAAPKLRFPILAYGEKGSFNYDIKNMNPGLKFWFSNTIRNMVLAYNHPDSYKEGLDESNPSGKEPVENPGDCNTSYSNEVKFFLKNSFGSEANFGQDWPENKYYKTCSGLYPNYNGHVHAGCVPVAMAQVMWYYRAPARIDWNNIPFNPSYINGSSVKEITTGLLFLEIKSSLEPWIWSSCKKGTGALTSTYDNLDKSFDVFGYDAYEFTGTATLRQELNVKRPVIAVGGSIGLSESDRHAWVIDGYKYYYYCDTGTSYLFVHCNWGWSGSENDYYGISGLVAGGGEYNHNLKFFKVIKR